MQEGKRSVSLRAIKKNGDDAQKIRLKFTGCRGFCERGPIVTIQPQGIFYQRVQEQDVPVILSETVGKGKILEHLLYEDAVTKRKLISEKEIPFYKAQHRLVMGNNGLIEPTQDRGLYRNRWVSSSVKGSVRNETRADHR